MNNAKKTFLRILLSVLIFGGAMLPFQVKNANADIVLWKLVGTTLQPVKSTWTVSVPGNATTTDSGVLATLSVGRVASTTIKGDSASSTFSGGIVTNKTLDVQSTTASSTFANGIVLSGGCISYQGSCLTSGAGGTPGGSDTQVQFNDAASFGGDAGMTYNKTLDRLTVSYASTTNLSMLNTFSVGRIATSTINGDNVASVLNYASTTALTVSGVGGLYVGTLTGYLKGTSGAVTAQSVPVPLSDGGTNATAFTTSGNAVYYNGVSLLTAPLTSAITAPYASSTVLSVSNSAYFATLGGTAGVGTTSPAKTFSVQGNALISGITRTGGLIATSTLQLPEQSFGGTILAVATGTIASLRPFANAAVTVTKVVAMVDCTSGLCATGATFNILHATSKGSASTTAAALFTSNINSNSTTTPQSFTTGFSDATIAAGEVVWINVVDATSSPAAGNLMFRVYYDVD